MIRGCPSLNQWRPPYLTRPGGGCRTSLGTHPRVSEVRKAPPTPSTSAKAQAWTKAPAGRTVVNPAAARWLAQDPPGEPIAVKPPPEARPTGDAISATPQPAVTTDADSRKRGLRSSPGASPRKLGLRQPQRPSPQELGLRSPQRPSPRSSASAATTAEPPKAGPSEPTPPPPPAARVSAANEMASGGTAPSRPESHSPARRRPGSSQSQPREAARRRSRSSQSQPHEPACRGNRPVGFRGHPLALGGPASGTSRRARGWTLRRGDRYDRDRESPRATAARGCLPGPGTSWHGRAEPDSRRGRRAGLLPGAVRPGGVRASGQRNARSARCARRGGRILQRRRRAAVDHARDRRRTRVCWCWSSRPARRLVL